MSNFWNILKKSKYVLFNKYILVISTFMVLVTFFDQHSLIRRWESYNRISLMEEELKYYKDEIKATKEKKIELESSKENIEKFAREKYNMKNKDEDIFIIKE